MMKEKNQDWSDIILNSIADGVFTINCDQDITYFNAAAEKSPV
jgi:PAS domain-containing protein